MKTKQVEVVVCFDKLFSVMVDAPVDDEGEVNWEDAEKQAYEQAPAIIRDEVFNMTEKQIEEYCNISDANEVN